MLKENCKKGMKVTTTGRTARNTSRESSACCKGESRIGYVKVRYVSSEQDKITVEHEQYYTEFLPQNVHPYWGDK